MAQRKIPENLLAYLPKEAESYSQNGIDAFYEYTERGRLPGASCVGFSDLIQAHTIASRCPSPLLEGLWVEGWEDFPPKVMLRYALVEALAKPPAYWFRKLPLWERMYRFAWAMDRTANPKGGYTITW